jgi:CRP/FNR family transcriptional regulator, cyclic AMP receptor protein
MTICETSRLGGEPLLRGLPAPQLAQLAAAARYVSVPAGRRLFEEGGAADRFWLIEAGLVRLDKLVPGQGSAVVEDLGRGAVIGLSWLLPPYQWQYGALIQQSLQAFEFDAAAVAVSCRADPALGYALTTRFLDVAARRLQATRACLLARRTPSQEQSA